MVKPVKVHNTVSPSSLTLTGACGISLKKELHSEQIGSVTTSNRFVCTSIREAKIVLETNNNMSTDTLDSNKINLDQHQHQYQYLGC